MDNKAATRLLGDPELKRNNKKECNANLRVDNVELIAFVILCKLHKSLQRLLR